MVSVYTSSAAAAALAVTLYASNAPLADAHQRIMNPPPKYTVNDKDKNWSPISFIKGPNSDLLGFIKSKGGTTLRDFMDNKSLYKIVNDPAVNFECGWTDPNGPRQPIPSDGMIRSTGYTHEGPCEIWLDNTRVLKGDNCHKSVTATKGSYKIDWSACKGNCMLRWYWFGNRFVKNAYSWQVYKACVPMKGGGARSATQSREMNGTADAYEVDGFALLSEPGVEEEDANRAFREGNNYGHDALPEEQQDTIDADADLREGPDAERDAERAAYPPPPGSNDDDDEQ